MTEEGTACARHAGQPLEPLETDAQVWQRRASTQILAALALAFPMAAASIWVYLLSPSATTIRELLLYPLLGGGALIFWIIFLHLFICGDRLSAFGFDKGRLSMELALGFLMGIGFLGLQFAFNATIARLFPPRPPAPEIVELMAGLARNPWLLALWLGPVVWIGVALFEELARAFLLIRLWRVFGGSPGKWAVLAVVSALIGLAHGYQGPAAILSIWLQSMLMGWYFMATGRVRVLIVAHALYDSIQIILAVVMIRQLGL